MFYSEVAICRLAAALPFAGGLSFAAAGHAHSIVYGCFCLSFAWTMSYIWIGPYIATHAAQRHQLYTMRPAEQNQKETVRMIFAATRKGSYESTGNL